jgi:hypothetical protein
MTLSFELLWNCFVKVMMIYSKDKDLLTYLQIQQ